MLMLTLAFLKKSNVLSITKGSVKDVNERSVLKSIGQTFNTLDDGFPVIHRKVEPVFHQIEKRKKFKKSKGSGFKVQSRK